MAASGLAKAGGFVRRMDKQVTSQTARRAGLPAHHSIAALESSRNKVRGRIEKRAFTFRNQRRMNLLLALMRHYELRLDQHDAYTELLREAYIASEAGSPPSEPATAPAAPTTSARNAQGRQRRTAD